MKTPWQPSRPPGLVQIAWPLFTELLLGTLVGLAGLALAARVSDASSGAYAMANHVQQAFFLLFRIISMGVSVVITQQLGAGDRAGADASARAALGASSWLGLGAGLTVAAGASLLLGLMNVPAEVLPLAQPFLQWLAIGLALDAYNASMAAVMRAHLHARDALLVMLAMQALHLLLCLPLMDGIGPLPALGLPGFAIALAASRALGLVLHLWLWKRRLAIVPTRGDWWTIHRGRLGPVLHIGLPGAAENVAWRGAYVFSISVVGSMGTLALATHAYTMQLIHFVLLFAATLGLAAEIMVGHLVGAGRLHQANQLVRRLLGRGLAMALGVSLLVALAGRWLMGWFTADAQIIATGALLLWLTIVLETGRTFNLVLVNALRAAGDARFPMQAGALSFGLVMAGGSWLLGAHLGWGLVGVWVAYAADEWLRGLLNWWRWSRLGWLPAARQMHRRLHQSGRFH